MSDELIDIRTLLAASKNARVEIGSDGVLHVLAGPVTLHMDRTMYQEFTTTLAQAMLALAAMESKEWPRTVTLVRKDDADEATLATRRGGEGAR